MWSRIGRSLGLYGPAALETEPIVSVENAGITSPPPEARRAAWSPSYSLEALIIPPGAPELTPCPPTIEWMAKVRALQQSGMAYDNSLFMLGIVGYYYPPRWLEEFDAKWLSTYVPAWKLDLPRPPDAPKIFHFEWRQRSLKELFVANQMPQARYHEALVELNTLGRDIVDDPEIAAIYNAEATTFPASRPNWGSADSTAWGHGRDTRSTPAPLWAPNPGPPPAEGQPVSIIVARGELPAHRRNSLWGSLGGLLRV